MQTLLLLILGSHSLTGFSQSNDYSICDLKAGKFIADSSPVYLLPFEKGKKGTKICAARDGVVIAARKDSDKGGLKPENLSDGNHVSIRHKDGSVAHYWHFK